MLDIEIGGLFGLIILVADIWAIIHIVQSSTETIKKVLWVLLILVLPLMGFIIWWFVGPREPKGLRL